ncbi:hypothetical protein PIB30_053345 [Stylosanthes scabra]|uniref:Uncharacterized protein n=1 Tax=Stylosanthes scabra TaxID=79078 RepID=A0ABU6UKG8_9FABA|nr:hypothetical protein [Stylosanthes scabra]
MKPPLSQSVSTAHPTLPQSLTLKPCIPAFTPSAVSPPPLSTPVPATTPTFLRPSVPRLSRRLDNGLLFALLFSGEAANRWLVSKTVTTRICSALSACDRLTATTVSLLFSAQAPATTSQPRSDGDGW